MFTVVWRPASNRFCPQLRTVQGSHGGGKYAGGGERFRPHINFTSRWPSSSGGGLQNRRGWCDSSMGFQPSPATQWRAKAVAPKHEVRRRDFLMSIPATARPANFPSGIGVDRHTSVFQTEIEGALPSCPSTFRDANTGAGQDFHRPGCGGSTPPSCRGLCRRPPGLQTLTVKSRLLTGENSVRFRGNPPF